MKPFHFAATLMALVVPAPAATIAWDFESGTPAVASSNDTGLTVGNLVQTSTLEATTDIGYIAVISTQAGSGTLGSGIRAGVAARNATQIAVEGPVTMSFTITVPLDSVVNLTTLAFEQGFNERGDNSITPAYAFTINDGASDIYSTAGALPQHTNATDTFYSQDVSLDLSAIPALQGLTNKTLTFKWNFTNVENRGNSLAQRANTLDDIGLNLTVIPEPTAAVLGGLGLLVLLRRRR